jgi:soluble lytic murein transglycosylase-like protein
MTTLALAALILRLQGLPVAPGPAEVRAQLLAAMITIEADRQGVDAALIAAVIQHESGFRRDAVGALGEQGLLQLKRGTLATAGYDHLSDVGLRQPRINIHLGARHLAHVRALCGNVPAASWLSVYSGRKKCRPSPYSRAILKLLADAQPPEVAAK